MLDVLEYILGDFWRFLQVVVLLVILVQWKPFEVNVLNGYWKGKKDDD